MKLLTFTILSAVVAFAQASTISWLTTVPLILMNINVPVEGFFGMFRRRRVPTPPVVPAMKDTPEGPVRFSVPNFSPQAANNFYNPFGSSGFFPNFQNVPNFAGGFQGNQFNQPQRQSWFSANQNRQPPRQSQPSNFMQQSSQSEQPQFMGQNSGSEPSQFVGQNFGQEQSFDRDVRFEDQPPAINTEEAESFFTLLAETDENKCISRLVCEMGADPGSAGELGQTISEIIGSLTDFPPGSRVSEYNDVLRKGRSQGISSCVSEYSACDQETYLLMKSNQPGENETPES